MSGLLEVIALHENDAKRAEDGGADRVELLGSMDFEGTAPEPAVLARTRAAVSIQIRPMLHLREGWSTDGGEATRLKGLISAYLDAGADGIVLGFLNGLGEVDRGVCEELVAGIDVPWTFHRAIDWSFDYRKAWQVVGTLPGIDQVLTAGSSRGLGHGLDEVLAIAKDVPGAADLIMAGGGLKPEHVPWLVRAGVRAFHIGTPARPQGSYKAWVDSDLVSGWRRLIDDEVAHRRH